MLNPFTTCPVPPNSSTKCLNSSWNFEDHLWKKWCKTTIACELLTLLILHGSARFRVPWRLLWVMLYFHEFLTLPSRFHPPCCICPTSSPGSWLHRPLSMHPYPPWNFPSEFTPENGWLQDDSFPFGVAYFQGLLLLVLGSVVEILCLGTIHLTYTNKD